MAQSRPVALCTQLLPSGKLCRGIALRGQHYCRSHIRNYRLLEADRARNAALEKLSAEVERMAIPDLLEAIRDRLLNLSRSHAILRLPELCYLLTVAIEELTPFKSNIKPEPTPIQIPDNLEQLSPSEFNQMLEGLFKSNA
jgi:hypothetical protein